MTIHEMKLAVCKKLKLVEWCGRGEHEGWRWVDSKMEIHWPTEGLQVCHEAENLIFQKQQTWREYVARLKNLYGDGASESCVIHASYEQRLEALCRVWFPERFQS